MRILFLTILTFFCACGVFAQTEQNSPTEQKPKDLQVDSDRGNVDPLFTDCELSELPWSKRPTKTLQQALVIADNYIKQEKIDISDYYLLLAKPNPYKLEQSWLFRWAKLKNKKGENYIEIVVSMNGQASQIKEQHKIQ